MNSRQLRRAGTLGAVAFLGVIGFGGPGAQAKIGAADTATITMEVMGKSLFFEGPRSVDARDELLIVNNTDAREIGPHTFSLVEKDEYPELSKEGIKACFKEGVCARIFKAHRVDPVKEKVGRKVARVGKDGWDSPFGKRGDSWFSLEQDETFSQKVSAKPGTTLFYFCTIHPEMQGKIKVK